MPNDRLEQGFRLIERCRADADIAELVREFLTTIAAFGFNTAACGGWVSFGNGRAPRFYFNSWPQTWLTLYTERNLVADDPIVHAAQRRATPFVWSEISWRDGRREQANDVSALVRAHGWKDGLVVPAHGPSGYVGLVSMAAAEPLDLAGVERACLWALALAIHDRCRTSPGMGIGMSAVPSLSAREVECMRWVAAGKTEWEIGRLLGIAESTVHFHVAKVKRRLGTSRRATAVALLVLHGLL